MQGYAMRAQRQPKPRGTSFSPCIDLFPDAPRVFSRILTDSSYDSNHYRLHAPNGSSRENRPRVKGVLSGSLPCWSRYAPRLPHVDQEEKTLGSIAL